MALSIARRSRASGSSSRRAGVDGEFFPDGRWRSILIVNVGVAADDGASEREGRLEFADVALVV